MKEASGELNMTLITIIAVVAIAGLFYTFKDQIWTAVTDKWGEIDQNGVVLKINK